MSPAKPAKKSEKEKEKQARRKPKASAHGQTTPSVSRKRAIPDPAPGMHCTPPYSAWSCAFFPRCYSSPPHSSLCVVLQGLPQCRKTPTLMSRGMRVTMHSPHPQQSRRLLLLLPSRLARPRQLPQIKLRFWQKQSYYWMRAQCVWVPHRHHLAAVFRHTSLSSRLQMNQGQSGPGPRAHSHCEQQCFSMVAV